MVKELNCHEWPNVDLFVLFNYIIFIAHYFTVASWLTNFNCPLRLHCFFEKESFLKIHFAGQTSVHMFPIRSRCVICYSQQPRQETCLLWLRAAYTSHSQRGTASEKQQCALLGFLSRDGLAAWQEACLGEAWKPLKGLDGLDDINARALNLNAVGIKSHYVVWYHSCW